MFEGHCPQVAGQLARTTFMSAAVMLQLLVSCSSSHAKFAQSEQVCVISCGLLRPSVVSILPWRMRLNVLESAQGPSLAAAARSAVCTGVGAGGFAAAFG